MLFYGGGYKQKAEAKRIAKSLEAREKVVFEVQPGEKTVMVKSHKIILTSVPDNFIPLITDELGTLEDVEIANQEEESLEPAEEASGEGEATEE